MLLADPAKAASGEAHGDAALVEPNASEIVDFLLLAGRLKHVPRTGWVRAGVRDVESVADHSWRMACAALLLGGAAGVSGGGGHAAALALVHDLAEALVGDIAPGDGVPPEEKRRLESAAMNKIAASLGAQSGAAAALLGAFHEYEAGASAAAVFVKDLDRLDLVVQALEYEAAQPELQLDSFFDGVRGRLRTPVLAAAAAEVDARRCRLRVTRCGDKQIAHAQAPATPPTPWLLPAALGAAAALITAGIVAAALRGRSSSRSTW